jgi:septum site-determining protein MinD
MALYHADQAIIVTNPEVSSVRDSDRILGILQSKSKRAEENLEPVREHLMVTRYDLDRVERGEMLTVDDVTDILSIQLLGVVPEDQAVLRASNIGQPVILDDDSTPGAAYGDDVARFLGEDVPHRFLKREKRGVFQRLFRRTA